MLGTCWKEPHWYSDVSKSEPGTGLWMQLTQHHFQISFEFSQGKGTGGNQSNGKACNIWNSTGETHSVLSVYFFKIDRSCLKDRRGQSIEQESWELFFSILCSEVPVISLQHTLRLNHGLTWWKEMSSSTWQPPLYLHPTTSVVNLRFLTWLGVFSSWVTC